MTKFTIAANAREREPVADLTWYPTLVARESRTGTGQMHGAPDDVYEIEIRPYVHAPWEDWSANGK